jgi:hypothetical protein
MIRAIPAEYSVTPVRRMAAMTAAGTSQPWQLPRRTAGHGSKADAGAQPLTEREQWIAELEQAIELVVATGAPREPRCPAWVVLGHFAGS